jgi:type IV pilus assembly protein PilA
MFKQKLQRGFTLIELLVVIAIIGILAATVLAALGTARQSGSDATIQSQVNSTKAQAELYYNSASTYAGVCGAGTNTLTSLMTALTSVSTSTTDTAATSTAAQTGANSNTVFCNANATAWVVSAPLNAGGYFCADSTGFSGKRVTAITPVGTYVCPAS